MMVEHFGAKKSPAQVKHDVFMAQQATPLFMVLFTLLPVFLEMRHCWKVNYPNMGNCFKHPDVYFGLTCKSTLMLGAALVLIVVGLRLVIDASETIELNPDKNGHAGSELFIGLLMILVWSGILICFWKKVDFMGKLKRDFPRVMGRFM